MLLDSKNSHLLILSLVFFAMSFSFSVFAKEYGVSDKAIISTEGVGEFSDTQIYDFTVSGGETIGVVPIKSYVTVEGLYKGGGSVFVYFDGNEKSGEVFDLPDGGDVQNLQIVLGDKLKILESNTAGTFNHQLYIRPQGVIISSVSIHVTNTYSRDVGNKCEEGDPSTVKSKTVQFWVANETKISGSQMYTINYGLNDDLLGINNPIISSYVEVVGMYDTGGNVDIYFNNKNIDGVTHELPTPDTYKEVVLLSKDVRDLLQSQSGSDFTLPLHIETDGLDFANVSAKFVVTYKYHPMKAGCSGLPPTGEFTSPVLDTGSQKGVAYNSITWKGVLGGELKDTGHVRFQLATSPCTNGASNYPTCSIGSWDYVGGKTCSNTDWFDSISPDKPIDLFSTGCSDKLDNKQYYRYKIQLCSEDCVISGKTTPLVDEVYVSWSP